MESFIIKIESLDNSVIQKLLQCSFLPLNFGTLFKEYLSVTAFILASGHRWYCNYLFSDNLCVQSPRHRWIYLSYGNCFILFRSSLPEVFLREGILKICIKLAAEHPRRSVISITLQRNFIEIALRHGCSPVNLLHIFRTSFIKNTSGWLLLIIEFNGFHGFHLINFHNWI